jgi:predicted DNA-binding protein (MmcQ/YjbR family)
MANDIAKASAAVRAYALGLPEAYEDFPWGESVAKVGKKVFVFLGKPGDAGGMGLSVKLPSSGAIALTLPFVTPTGYGLGARGWVSASFAKGDRPPVELLCAWIAESYRAVAPKKLAARVAEDGDGEGAVKKGSARSAKRAPAKKATAKKKAAKKSPPAAKAPHKATAARAPRRRG